MYLEDDLYARFQHAADASGPYPGITYTRSSSSLSGGWQDEDTTTLRCLGRSGSSDLSQHAEELLFRLWRVMIVADTGGILGAARPR